MMIRPAKRLEGWESIRTRMLRETEAFIEDAFRHPERCMVIPAIRVGEGSFPRGYADLFWASVLGAS